jgi:hypothetical protein
MMDKSDAQYYSRRMREEQEAALRAAPVAAAIHQELAEKYAGVIAAYEKKK